MKVRYAELRGMSFSLPALQSRPKTGEGKKTKIFLESQNGVGVTAAIEGIHWPVRSFIVLLPSGDWIRLNDKFSFFFSTES